MKINFFKDYSLDEKIFCYALFFMVFLSTFSILGNIIIGYDFIVNYKWICLIIVSLIAIKYSLRKKYLNYFQIIMSSLVIFIFLPNGWITAGGSNNFTLAYGLLICMCICFILKGKTRLFFVISEIIVIILLVYLEMYFPELIYKHPQEKIYRDLIIQMPLTLSAAAYMVIIFSNAYRKERQKLKEYSELLKEKNSILFKISRIDELTGIYNRRYVFEELNEIKGKMQGEKSKVIIIMIDIDNFKNINDTYGHVVGDDILKEVSSIIVRRLGDKGFVGRYGGDEFLIVLETVNINNAKDIMEQIKIELERIDLGKEFKITISGGMAQLSKCDDIDKVLANADKLLYKVKKSGKNGIASNEDNCILTKVST